MNYEIHQGLVPEHTIFLHGNLASNAWWKPSLEIWENKKIKTQTGSLIFAEWRGCGKTELSSISELTLQTLANDYIELIEQLDLKKVNLVGHSTGGLIGLYAMRARPELFHRTVLLDSVSATGIQFGPEMYAAFDQMKANRAICEAVMASTIYNFPVSQTLLKQIVDDAFGVSEHIWHGIPKLLNNVDFRAELKNIHQPTLVLHGEQDTLLPIQGSEELAKLLPNGRFYKIPNRGHSCNVENPALFVELTERFLFG